MIILILVMVVKAMISLWVKDLIFHSYLDQVFLHQWGTQQVIL